MVAWNATFCQRLREKDILNKLSNKVKKTASVKISNLQINFFESFELKVDKV